jgi:hypothetical protein
LGTVPHMAQELVLSECTVGAEEAVILTSALYHNTTLTRLDMSRNPLQLNGILVRG